MIIQSKRVFKWVSVDGYCWHLIPEKDAAQSPVLVNSIANVRLNTSTGEYAYVVFDPDDCCTVIAQRSCDYMEHGKQMVYQVLRKCGYVYSA